MSEVKTFFKKVWKKVKSNKVKVALVVVGGVVGAVLLNGFSGFLLGAGVTTVGMYLYESFND